MQEKIEQPSLLGQMGTYLTEKSENYVDWFNIGGLVQQRTRETITGLWHYYSWRELMVRGGIIATTLIGIAYGATTDSPYLNATVYGTAGFVASHTVALAPTFFRRHKIDHQTEKLYENIQENLRQLSEDDNYSNISQLITAKVKLLHDHVFLAHKRGDAFNNLLKKKSLMIAIDTNISELKEQQSLDIKELENFWQQEPAELINYFLDNCTQLQNRF